MQIDFHHAVTYVCCRLAGMADAPAQIVAHAAQYVDDATNDGPLNFETGARYVVEEGMSVTTARVKESIGEVNATARG